MTTLIILPIFPLDYFISNGSLLLVECGHVLWNCSKSKTSDNQHARSTRRLSACHPSFAVDTISSNQLVTSHLVVLLSLPVGHLFAGDMALSGYFKHLPLIKATPIA
jgi:hypothetical protein